jgi:hypothetical protein
VFGSTKLLEYSESVRRLWHQSDGANLINLRKTRDLFLLLTLVVVLVVAVVLSRARLLQVPSCCSEGRRACIGGATTQDRFSAPHAVPGFVAVLTSDEIKKTVAIQSSVLPPKTAHTFLRERVWRYAPKTSPPGFLA